MTRRTVNGEDLVGLFAKGRIVAGTELTYNYKFESNGARQKCLCGATNCRGTAISCYMCTGAIASYPFHSYRISRSKKEKQRRNRWYV